MSALRDRIVLGDYHVAAEEWGKGRHGGAYHRMKLVATSPAAGCAAHLEVDVPHEHVADAHGAKFVRVVLEVLDRRELTDKERIAELERRVRELEGRRGFRVGDRVRILAPAPWNGRDAVVDEVHNSPRPYGLYVDGLSASEGHKWYAEEELERA